jgi:hypothetical protein
MIKLALGIVPAMAFAGFMSVAPAPASACNVNGNCDHTKGAPGPIAGAGLPFLALGVGAVYLMVRRRKSA